MPRPLALACILAQRNGRLGGAEIALFTGDDQLKPDIARLLAGQNDVAPETMGQYLNPTAIKRVFLLAANYQAGKDKLAGFRRANPDALFEFLPGATGIAFLKERQQSGLADKINLYADRGGLDETMLGAVGEAATGAAASTPS